MHQLGEVRQPKLVEHRWLEVGLNKYGWNQLKGHENVNLMIGMALN